jgi:uncharacterized membrane protein YbhN (UPF0104 family)
MGTFTETAIFDNLLSFADQGKQTSAFRFRLRKFAVSVFHLQQTNGNWRFLLNPFFVSVCVCVCKYLCLYCSYIYIYIYSYIYIYIYIYMLPFQTENGNGRPGDFP